jgi:hypothetical protein
MHAAYKLGEKEGIAKLKQQASLKSLSGDVRCFPREGWGRVALLARVVAACAVTPVEEKRAADAPPRDSFCLVELSRGKRVSGRSGLLGFQGPAKTVGEIQRHGTEPAVRKPPSRLQRRFVKVELSLSRQRSFRRDAALGRTGRLHTPRSNRPCGRLR